MLKDKLSIIALIIIALTTTTLACLDIYGLAVLLFTLGTSIILIHLYIQLHRQANNEPVSAISYLILVMGALSVGSSFIGTMFKVMHWPGGGPLMVIAMTLPAIAGIVVAISYAINWASGKRPSLLPYLLVFIPFLFTVVTGLTRVFLAESSIKEKVIDHITTEYWFSKDLLSQQRSINDKLYAVIETSIANDSIDMIHNHTNEMLVYLEGVQRKLIDDTGGRNEDGSFLGKSETIKTAIFLLGPEGMKSGEAYSCEEKLKEFYSLFGKEFRINRNRKNISLAEYRFPYGTTMTEALLSISHLQMSVLQLEEEYYLSKK